LIVADLNLLVYAFNASAREHSQAAAWWEQLLNSQDPVGVPWVVHVGFLRLMSGRHVVAAPYGPAEALAITDAWYERPNVRLLMTTDKTRSVLGQLIRTHDIRGSLVTDAAIAASALEHRGTLHTNDTDFSRFTQLRTHNPIGA
jgi:toxin-antitoxin system PIN domain toxin